MNLKIESGDATAVSATKTKGLILAHIVNCKGVWARGFVQALDKMSPIPKATYFAWKAQSVGDIPLGDALLVEVEPGKFVANMCAQKSVDREADGPCLLDYQALERCLRIVFLRALRLGYDVHIPEGIGSGMAGGNKEKILKMIEATAKKSENESSIVKFAREYLNQNVELNITLWRFEDKTASSYVEERNPRNREGLLSELSCLDGLLQKTPVDDVLSRGSIESRIRVIKERLGQVIETPDDEIANL